LAGRHGAWQITNGKHLTMSIETVKSYDERLKAGVKGEEDERAEEATDALKDVGGGVSVSSEGGVGWR